MSAWTNEVEERRVIRLLSDAAADVAPLTPEDVDELLHSATQGERTQPRSRRRLPRQLQPLIAAAAAAAVVIGVALGSSVPRTHPASPEPATANAKLASFPEGSALELLLSVNGSDSTS